MKLQISKILHSTRKNLDQIRLNVDDGVDLQTSKRLDISGIETVCLTLGPYRNLTTLTASVLFLHPNCQVLNHAGKRIYGNKQIDFLADFTPKKLNRFIQFAMKISGKGARGGWGGSITYSHAFGSDHKMKDVYKEADLELVKKQPKSLFWKESLLTSNVIRDRKVDLGKIFEVEDRLRFLLPIRNPLDCAFSNHKIGYAGLFPGLTAESSQVEVLQAVLEEIYWFAILKSKFPDRFFTYYENDISSEVLGNLAAFLKLDPRDDWINNALLAMKIKSGYSHDENLVNFYRELYC